MRPLASLTDAGRKGKGRNSCHRCRACAYVNADIVFNMSVTLRARTERGMWCIERGPSPDHDIDRANLPNKVGRGRRRKSLITVVVGGRLESVRCVRAVSAPNASRQEPCRRIVVARPSKGAGIGGVIPERLSGSFASLCKPRLQDLYRCCLPSGEHRRRLETQRYGSAQVQLVDRLIEVATTTCGERATWIVASLNELSLPNEMKTL